MKIRLNLSAGILVLGFLLCQSAAVYPELREVTLNECIEMAIQNHPEIKAADEDNVIAQANYVIAKARNRPVINLEVKTIESRVVDEQGRMIEPGNGIVDVPGKDTMIGLYAGPTLIYNLVDPQRSSIIDSTKYAIDLEKMRALRTKEDIILNVKKNFYGYLFAKENMSKREELVKKFQLKLDMAKLLFRTGQRPILDVTKSDVDLADARLEYEKAKNYENIVKTELLTSMGIIDEDIDFSPVKVEKLPELRFTLKKLYQLAEIYNSDLKIARIVKDINRLNIDTARAAHYPVVDLLGMIGLENNNIIYHWDNPFKDPDKFQEKMQSENWNKNINVGLSAKINLWSGGALDAKVDSKAAEYNKSKYLEREALLKIRAMIRNYFQSISEYKKQVELSELVIANSQKHLMLARKSYENGISTQLDMQDAEMILMRSQLGYVKVGYDYLITLAKLANVVGLGEEYLCKK